LTQEEDSDIEYERPISSPVKRRVAEVKHVQPEGDSDDENQPAKPKKPVVTDDDDDLGEVSKPC
jgi:hypothetical protein